MMLRLRQFTEILRCHVCVSLQTFYDTRLHQFTEILRYPVCVNLYYRAFTIPDCVNLQRFYDAQFVLIYSSVIHRHFMSDVQSR